MIVRFLVLCMVLCCASAAVAEEVRAFWVSPDWLLPGDRRVSAQEAAGIAEAVVSAVKAQGANTIFLETLLRGQLIGPCARVSRTTGQLFGLPPILNALSPALLLGAPRVKASPAGTGGAWSSSPWPSTATGASAPVVKVVAPPPPPPVVKKAAVTVAPPVRVSVPANPPPAAPVAGADALPVYPLCQWNYEVVDGWPQDLLSLMVAAGKRHGVKVHAWVHCFYWRSDNESFRKPWQDGPSLWDDLLVEYLQRASKLIRFLPRQRALAYLASELAKGFTWGRFIAALDRWGAGGFEGRWEGLVRSVVSAEGPAPEFLVTNPRGETHYGMEADRILAVYLNPEDPRVTRRLEQVVQQIVASHPGLAGVHLDHVRYPKGPFGGPGAWKDFPANLRIAVYDVPKGQVANVWPQMLARREGVITRMVEHIRAALPHGLALSAAVYPTYYASRASAALPLEAYICQDWASWPVDFVTPMIYGKSLPQVQHELALCRSGGQARAGGRVPAVYPGVSSLSEAHAFRSWAFFDMQGLSSILSHIPGSAMKTMGLKDRLL